MQHQPPVAVILSGFPDFVARQPADKPYTYFNSSSCAFGSYLTALGVDDHSVGCSSFTLNWRETHPDWHQLPVHIYRALFLEPHTFGALRSRLNASRPS